MENTTTPTQNANPAVTQPSSIPTTAVVAAPIEPNLLQKTAQFMDEGGIFMWVIFAIWCFGVAVCFERIKKLFSYDVDGEALMVLVKKHVLSNDVQKAIQTCSNSKSLLAQVLKSGLKRSNQSKEQIKDAVECTILEVIPKAEQRLGHLSLVANLSTLLGLLGTIQGLIQSFAAVANADPASKAKLLAMGIATAMNTTALGLIAAISIMIFHSALSSKSEKIIAEIDQFSSKLIDLLGTKHMSIVEKSNDEDEKNNMAA